MLLMVGDRASRRREDPVPGREGFVKAACCTKNGLPLKLRTVVAWLPQEIEARPLGELESWKPKGVARLAKEVGWRSLRYIVIDELEHGVAGLVASPWPGVDELGRLHFGEEDQSVSVTVSEETFLTLLEHRRRPVVSAKLSKAAEEELRTRQLAIGDVFVAAVRVRFDPTGSNSGEEGAPIDPAEWIRGEVLDVTADAREACKAQTAAAVAGVMDDRYLETVGEELNEDS
jgi:head-tail adaptor